MVVTRVPQISPLNHKDSGTRKVLSRRQPTESCVGLEDTGSSEKEHTPGPDEAPVPAPQLTSGELLVSMTAAAG